jgi:two-component system NtrC family sensor kinase
MAQPTNLNELLQRLVDELRKYPRLATTQFVLQLEPAVPPIEADPLQLQQVFINLLNNAIEAMESKGGGTVTVATQVAPFGQGVRVAISDSGAGISEENRARLFTPFFTTKPVGKGTGLGLAIVYGIVKMHRGQIQVQSEEGKGTTFTITMPLRLSGTPQAAEGYGTM